MRIGATKAKGAHAGAAGVLLSRPFRKLIINIKWTISEVDLRIGFLKVEAGWNLTMFQCESGLDDPCYTRGRIQMTYIGLDRSDGAITL